MNAPFARPRVKLYKRMILTTCILAASMKTIEFKTARFVAVTPPIVFQQGALTSCELAPIDPAFNWDEAIVSWNVQPVCPANLKVEARVIYPAKTTKWYILGDWALIGDRKSVANQKDEDGTVLTDTLSMHLHGGQLQLRITGDGRTGEPPKLAMLGISFSDTTAGTESSEPNKAAYGKTIIVPARHQNDYPGGGGLCSPTTVSMLLWHWADSLVRPEMNQDVPLVQASVWDPVYNGAGNWPFNMAFAGSFPGMTAYVDRFGGMRELEDWIAAGIPVGCSVSYQLLRGKTLDRATEQGHLVVLVGFTAEGDPVFNDPASKETPKTYKRSDFLAAWEYSHRTVYLVYPEGAEVPKSELERWKNHN